MCWPSQAGLGSPQRTRSRSMAGGRVAGPRNSRAVRHSPVPGQHRRATDVVARRRATATVAPRCRSSSIGEPLLLLVLARQRQRRAIDAAWPGGMRRMPEMPGDPWRSRAPFQVYGPLSRSGWAMRCSADEEVDYGRTLTGHRVGANVRERPDWLRTRRRSPVRCLRSCTGGALMKRSRSRRRGRSCIR